MVFLLGVCQNKLILFKIEKETNTSYTNACLSVDFSVVNREVFVGTKIVLNRIFTEKGRKNNLKCKPVASCRVLYGCCTW